MILPTFARGFGFGQPTGINGLPEAHGLVPDPAWKKAERNDDWYLGDSVNLAIGQGFFLASPLQVANAYAAVARGGSLMTPVLVSKQGSQAFQAQPKGTLPVPAGHPGDHPRADEEGDRRPQGHGLQPLPGREDPGGRQDRRRRVGAGRTPTPGSPPSPRPTRPRSPWW